MDDVFARWLKIAAIITIIMLDILLFFHFFLGK